MNYLRGFGKIGHVFVGKNVDLLGVCPAALLYANMSRDDDSQFILRQAFVHGKFRIRHVAFRIA